jgi:hypothetical protein
VLVAAAVCPHPPLLVPGVATGVAGVADALREHTRAAVAQLAAAEPDLVVVVGSAPRVGSFPPDAWGSLRTYGVDVAVGEGPGEAALPLALTVGLWLLQSAAPDLPRAFFGVSADTDPARCATLGAGLAERSARVALLVMGDGSARRSVKGPGYLDPRAEPFDAEVAAALGDADPAALLAIDPVLADQLLAGGRAPWQVLAGAADGPAGRWHGAVTYAAAPFGVAYLVASWLLV